jgi:hypothetical protein
VKLRRHCGRGIRRDVPRRARPAGPHRHFTRRCLRLLPLDKLADLPADERAARSLKLADRRWTPEWLATHPEEAALVTALAADMSAEETQAQARGRLLQLEARKGHGASDLGA